MKGAVRNGNLASVRENTAKGVFIALAAFSILAVFAIVIYLLSASIPAFREIGFFKFLTGSIWSAKHELFGILPMIVSSLVLTVLSVILGGVLAIFTAVYMVYYCPIWMKKIYEQIINLLAGIPSLIFGYFGLVALKPVLDDLFNVGSSLGLLLSTLVLSIMILPTITSLVKNSLENVPMHYYEGALALGCTKNQAVWKVCLPAAKNGVIAALILGIGRAVGETMAVQLLLGNLVNYPDGSSPRGAHRDGLCPSHLHPHHQPLPLGGEEERLHRGQQVLLAQVQADEQHACTAQLQEDGERAGYPLDPLAHHRHSGGGHARLHHHLRLCARHPQYLWWRSCSPSSSSSSLCAASPISPPISSSERAPTRIRRSAPPLLLRACSS